MTKHTPGPWRVGQYTPTPAFREIENHSCVCDPVTMKLIALTGLADDRQSQIDADLIAAAPDLLEVLEELIKLEADNPQDVLGGIQGETVRQFKDKMRTAVKKAQGI